MTLIVITYNPATDVHVLLAHLKYYDDIFICCYFLTTYESDIIKQIKVLTKDWSVLG